MIHTTARLLALVSRASRPAAARRPVAGAAATMLRTRALHQTRVARHSAEPEVERLVRAIQGSPKVLAALAQLAQVLQKKGHMDLSDPRPPSPMKMMRVMGDAEVREAVAGMQRAMCDENIEFSATNLMAILRARGNGWASAGKDVRDPVEQSNVKPGAAAGEAKGLFSRVSGMFKSDAK